MKVSWRWVVVVAIIITIYILSDIINFHLINEDHLPQWLKQFQITMAAIVFILTVRAVREKPH